MFGDFETAISLVAEELEQELIDALESGNEVIVVSIYRSGDDSNMQKPLHTVQIMFDLLQKSPEILNSKTLIWHKLFGAFQLPIFLSQNHENPNTKKSIAMFFAFFFVNALERTSPDFVLMAIQTDVSSINAERYKVVLSSVFNFLMLQRLLQETLKDLLLEDSLQLNRQIRLNGTKADFVYDINSST
jgi:hypothetical protein